jgi:sec-independent protein translocase protein TatA
MFGLSIWELLIILAIVILVFGPSRLKTIGSDLGNAIKGFRTAVKDDEPENVQSKVGDKDKVEEQVENAASSASSTTNSAADQKTNV